MIRRKISNILYKLIICLLFCVLYQKYIYNVTYENITTDRGVIVTRINTKYVLQWTSKGVAPFYFLEKRDKAFINNKCKFRNCYITDDKNYFPSVKEFDAVIFNGVNVVNLNEDSLPKERSPTQKYIFGAMESADRYPVNSKHFDGFFNWTWTYKLDSDFQWRYMRISDLKGNTVGPKVNMQWLKKMGPIDDKLKKKLSNKKRAAAWIVSHCKTVRHRELFIAETHKHLRKLGLVIDIFGKCGLYTCSKLVNFVCLKDVGNIYFFYFAFENSFAEDYVTEKVVNALNNYLVPVVFGGANYSRFLPKGSYLNARELGPESLAYKMSNIISHKESYYDFFRWRNHYMYELRGRKDVCKLCTILNDREKVEKITVWNNFRNWWNENNTKLSD